MKAYAGVMNNKNKEGEVVTKSWVRGALREVVDDLAMIINKSFEGMESRMAKQEDLLTLTNRVDKLEKYMENRFDDMDRQFAEIRKQIKEVDSRADVVDLQLRVSALEKVAKTRMKKQGGLAAA